MNIEQIKTGFRHYYKECLAPLSWGMSLAEPVVMLGIANAERNYKAVLDMIKEEDGTIDVESLYEEYRKKIASMGHIEIAGIKFDTDDLDKLMTHIRKQEVTA